MNTIEEVEKAIVEEFSFYEDPMDRYEAIIEAGRSLKPLAEQWKTEERLVKGCQSKVWLRAWKEDGLIYFEADSNTAITKGIIALLVRVLSGRSPEDILACELLFIDKISLRGHLSSQRSSGLTSMIALMRTYAQTL